jgi:hypothetical protein
MLTDITLAVYGKENGAIKLEKVNGPNGAFISFTKADDSKFTVPCGKKSQVGRLSEYRLFKTDDDNMIATVNNYEVEEELVIE